MSIVTTETDFINLSLTLLKSDTIPSSSGPALNEKAKRLGQLWIATARREILSEYNWDFATKRVNISDSGASIFKWGNSYQLPSDFIRVVTINDEEWPEQRFEIENGFILCDQASPLQLRYIFDQDDYSKWTPKAVVAGTARLARYMSYGLTGSRALTESMTKISNDLVSEASLIDSQQNPPKRVERSVWKAARLGYKSSNYPDWRSWE